MLQVNFIRENKALVIERLQKRNIDWQDTHIGDQLANNRASIGQ